MSILNNAIDSIQVGVEDYSNDDERRSVSAVRNISAGILLLYKEKLRRMSPENNNELLIKQNIRPVKNESGEIYFEGKGKKTVDVQSIKERFDSLNVTVDWKRFDEINKLRNDLEHYYTSESPDTVKEIIAKSFLLIRDFLVEGLDEDPQDVLGPETWSVLLEVSEVYLAEDRFCKESLNLLDWKYGSVIEALKYLRCPKCNSSLIQAPCSEDIYPTINLRCKSCNEEFIFDNIIDQCIDDALGAEAFIAIKDGGESPYDTCPGCGKATFIFEESCCVSCEYEMDYYTCSMCEASLSLEEQDNGGLCSYCNYKWEKVMRE